MKLLALSGKASAGKSTVAKHLSSQYGWTRVSLADPLKSMCAHYFELTQEQLFGAKKEEIDERYGKSPRQILIDTGKFYRSIDPNFWVKRLREHILNQPQAQLGKYVIDDVRFVNEAEWVRKHGGRVVRLERAIELRGFELQDESECQLDDYPFDFRVPESWNTDASDIPKVAQAILDVVHA